MVGIFGTINKLKPKQYDEKYCALTSFNIILARFSEKMTIFAASNLNNLSRSIMKYKGYNIGKLSRYIVTGFSNKSGYVWNVNKDEKNVHFNTLKEAKEYINKQIKQ